MRGALAPSPLSAASERSVALSLGATVNRKGQLAFAAILPTKA